MKRYLKELKPTVFEDIIAMVALYRPGPMEWIPEYIAGKHGTKKVQYLHPKLQPILDKTYGVAIYQEQVMEIARSLAGFTMGGADVLRKAMGKKIAELLAQQKEKFIDGCVKNGISKDLAEKVFSFIEPFAGYGFNRSHAACYAMVGYQTAYLKAHYPAEFMAALLSSDQQDIDRIAIEIEECRNMGIKVLPPDVNESFASFTVVVGEEEGEEFIRFGLNAIKNVGGHIVEVIIGERIANGRYKDVFDLLERIVDKDMNKKSLEALIKCGAMDQFGDRSLFLGNIESLLEFNKEVSRSRDNKQISLFGGSSNVLPPRIKLAQVPAIDRQERLSWEKDLLGLYITEHPFNDFRRHLGDYVVPLSRLREHLNDEYVRVAGVITTIKKIITKSNKAMLFVKIEDAVAVTELLVFPTVLEKTPELWVEGKVIICQGKVSDKDQELKLLVDKACELSLSDVPSCIDTFKKIEVKSRNNFYRKGGNVESCGPSRSSSPAPAAPALSFSPLKVIINKELSDVQSDKIKNILLSRPGGSKVYFKVIFAGQPKIMETGFRVDNDADLKSELRNELGESISVVDD